MRYRTPLWLSLHCEFCGREDQDVFHYYQIQPRTTFRGKNRTHKRVYACLQCLLQKITCKFVEDKR